MLEWFIWQPTKTWPGLSVVRYVHSGRFLPAFVFPSLCTKVLIIPYVWRVCFLSVQVSIYLNLCTWVCIPVLYVCSKCLCVRVNLSILCPRAYLCACMWVFVCVCMFALKCLSASPFDFLPIILVLERLYICLHSKFSTRLSVCLKMPACLLKWCFKTYLKKFN